MKQFSDKLVTLNGELLDASALSAAVVRWQGEALDAAAGTHAAGQNVVGVQVISALREHTSELF